MKFVPKKTQKKESSVYKSLYIKEDLKWKKLLKIMKLPLTTSLLV